MRKHHLQPLLVALAILAVACRSQDAIPDAETAEATTSHTEALSGETAAVTPDAGSSAAFPVLARTGAAPASPTLCGVIDPTLISLNGQGLPYSWQAGCIGATVYSPDRGPMLAGLPTHIRIDFLPEAGAAVEGLLPPALRVIPAGAYLQQWDETDNPVVRERMEALRSLLAARQPLPASGVPVLPLEIAPAANDLAVQGKYLDLSHSDGVRFVGHFDQSANALTNQNLYYVYQGFAGENDDILVSFMYPLTTAALPDAADQVAPEEMDQVTRDPAAYFAEKADMLKGLSEQDWSPTLERLDALVASLEYGGQETTAELETYIPPMARALPFTYGVVTAPQGANIWLGPDPCYRGIGLAPAGTTLEIIGRSVDGAWWVTPVVGAPNNQGWFRASYTQAINAEAAPIIAVPPRPDSCAVPTPAPIVYATPTYVPVYPTAVPPFYPGPDQPYPDPGPTVAPPFVQPTIAFWADRNNLIQGECTTLRWSVFNAQQVWVYQQGQAHQNYPVAFDGARQVCPAANSLYELRVLKYDGTAEVRQAPINVLPGNDLANTNWTLTVLNGAPAAPGSSVMLYFGSGSYLQGFSGCNSYSGSYSAGGNGLTASVTSQSGSVCADAIISQEITYISNLQNARTYRVDGNQLTLFGPDGQETLRFAR